MSDILSGTQRFLDVSELDVSELDVSEIARPQFLRTGFWLRGFFYTAIMNVENINAVFWLSEIGIISLFLVWFALSILNVERDQARGVGIAVSSAVFAAIFENLNVLQVKGRGSYSYNADFHVFVGQVPLFVVLAWSVIFWTAMQLCDTLNLRTRHKILGDAVLVVLLDLGFDATAIRHNFWFWHDVKLNEAWFGVPAGNFFGWLFVALVFSFLTRALDFLVATQKLKAHFRVIIQIFMVPPLAFVLYRVLENSNNFVLTLFGWRASAPQTDKIALWFFFTQLCVLALWTLVAKRKTANIEYSKFTPTTVFARLCRAFFHGFALLGLLVLPASTPFLATQKPALLTVAGFVCWLDWFYEKRLRSEKVISL